MQQFGQSKEEPQAGAMRPLQNPLSRGGQEEWGEIPPLNGGGTVMALLALHRKGGGRATSAEFRILSMVFPLEERFQNMCSLLSTGLTIVSVS